MERSNTYIFIYSITLVVVVAAVLSFTAFTLKDRQQANVRNEKMQNILMSIGIESSAKDAQLNFDKYIKATYIIDKGQLVPFVVKQNGKSLDTITAFDVDMKRLYNPDNTERTLPVFVAERNDSTFTIIPLRGKGLWGPIWGFVAFGEDLNTVYGSVFDHKSETPGLGAEIKTTAFESQFKGKKIFNKAGEFVSVKVLKGGANGSEHAVDAISGGTITSTGVNDMIDTCLSGYINYFKPIK